MKFKSFLFGCPVDGKAVALYTDPIRIRLIVQDYNGNKLDGYRQHEVPHRYALNEWLAGAMGEHITECSEEQLKAVIEELKL